MTRASQEGPRQPSQPQKQTQKFLRYRSIRKAAVKEPEPDPLPPLPQPSQPATPSQTISITRLPSRYRRKPKSDPSPPPTPSVPQNLDTRKDGTTRHPEPMPEQHHPTVGGAQVENQGQTHNAREARHRDSAHKHTFGEDSPGAGSLRRSYEVAREEARLILEGEVDRLRELRAHEAQRRREKRERSQTRQKQTPADDGGLLHTHTSEVHDNSTDADREQSEVSCADGRRSLKDSSETNPAGHSPDSETSTKSRKIIIGGPPLLRRPTRHSRGSMGEQPRSPLRSHSIAERVRAADESRRTPVPTDALNFDAPVSAVNAGERRVNIQCKTTSITLPITPTTTCKDILNSASRCMSESIDPRTGILLESFSQLGLERPLRRYERIRDVMNSWDNDSQNHLFIMTEGECSATGLEVADAPRHHPTGTTVQLYHSHKPGRWDKRWVKLREDGQISVSKKENGLDPTNICHLSDFDVYTPTAKQAKSLKPPKKLCFALKSQEKSSMFLSGANFVHFFCTKDKTIAENWYRTVHSWRSWYLVNMLGEGHQPGPAVRHQSGTRPSTGRTQDSSPYSLESLRPLPGSRSSRPSGERSRRTNSGVSRPPSQDVPRPLIDFVPERHTSASRPGSPTFQPHKPQGFPPTAFPTKFVTGPAHLGSSDDADGPFTGTGLLARSTSRRSQGGSRSGRGVQGVDGKPLVDLHPTSEFTDGSLLRKMEAIAAQQGMMQPRIDREKRREMDVAVGEGFG